MVSTFQKYSKIPLLVASNCEAGGNGGGTAVSCGASTAASRSPEVAYKTAKVSMEDFIKTTDGVPEENVWCGRWDTKL